jgi:hypothetical protein
MPPPSFIDTFGGSNVYPSDPTLLSITTAVSLTLAWPIEQARAGDLVVANIIEVTATAGGVVINLTDARQASKGYTTLFNNLGANTFTVKDAGGNTLLTVASGQVWQLYLSDNSTVNGVWKTFQYGVGVSSANAAALAGAGLKAITTTLNEAMVISSHNTNYVAVDGDRAKVLLWTGGTGTFTLPDPATVGADWFVPIKNLGSGILTIIPAAGTLDGGANKTFTQNGSALVVSTGTSYFTIGFGVPINSIFDFIVLDVSGSGDFTLAGGNLNRIAYEFIGVLTGPRNIIVPNVIQQYWVDNETTGAFTLTVKTAAGTGVTVSQGSRTILYCNGVDVVHAETVVATVPVPINQGGTGATVAATALSNLGGVATTRNLIAGAGLVGGGDLSADRTFDVGAGTGVTVNANDVALSAGTLTSLGLANTAVQPARTIIAGAGLVGGGDLSADRTLDVGAGAGITVNANDVALDTSSNRNVDHSAVTITGLNSVTGGGDITTSRTLQLSGDAASPGNFQYYGTDGAGAKGYHPLPSGAANTWQDMTGSRALGVTYTNTSGVRIQVLVALANSGVSASAHLILNGIDFQVLGNATGGALVIPVTFDVPAGETYQLNQASASVAITTWLELRP